MTIPTVIMEFEKETKNTIRFKEVLANPEDKSVISSLYINKGYAKDIKRIRVSVDMMA